MGGLARKATILDEISLNYENPFVVDAGNLFFSKELLEPGISSETALISAETILQSLNTMGLTVFSPGSKDFAAGLDFLINASKKAKFPFISANIYDEKGALIFDPYIIKEQHGYKIAFIGLSSIFESPGIEVKNPMKSINSIIGDLLNKSDFQVLLFSSDDKDIKDFQKGDIDIDMVIRSRNKQRSFDGGPYIPTYSVGDKGKILYEFDLEINDPSMPLTDIAWCNRTIEQSKIRLDKMKKGDMLVDLHKLYKSDPATMKRILAYESRIEEASQRLQNIVNKITFNKIELAKDIDGRIDILKIVDKGKLEIKSITTPQLDLENHHEHKHHRHIHDHDGDGYPDH